MNHANNTITVKITHEGTDEIRRFQLPCDHLSFSALSKKIQQLWGSDSPLILRYRDDENDLVTLSTDEELADAIAFTPKSPLRLFAKVGEKSAEKAADKASAKNDPSNELESVLQTLVQGFPVHGFLEHLPMLLQAATSEQPRRGSWRCGGGSCMRPPHCGGPAKGEQPTSRFVQDVSIFDGTEVAPNTAFTKIWRLRNTGPVAWPAGAQLLFVGGDQMSCDLTTPLPGDGAVPAGAEVDVAVQLVAPSEAGRYVGYWRLAGPHGRRFGQRIWSHIQVVDTSQPAQAPSAEEEAAAAAAVVHEEEPASAPAAPHTRDPTVFAALAQALPDAPLSPGDRESVHILQQVLIELGKMVPGAIRFASGLYGRFTTAAVADVQRSLGREPTGVYDEAVRAQLLKELASDVQTKKLSSLSQQCKPDLKAGCGSPPIPVSADDSELEEALLLSMEEVAQAQEAAMAADAAQAAARDQADQVIPAPAKQAATAAAATSVVTNLPLMDTTTAAPATAVATPAVAQPAEEEAKAAAPNASGLSPIEAALAAMGFDNQELNACAIQVHGQNLEACTAALGSLTSDWADAREDLEEMGFGDALLNQKLLLKYNGSVKQVVKELVQAAR